VKLRDTREGRIDLDLAGAPVGPMPGEIPRFLMIVGSPTEVPWALQYNLQYRFKVGRLDLPPAGLDHYCQALLSGFGDEGADANTALWSVSHGPSDITALMKRTVAAQLAKRLRHFDKPLDWRSEADDAVADEAQLLEQLARQPRVIVTTSHGATPVHDAATLAATLGMPVDQTGRTVTVPSDWEPRGAVWIAQACCSAGSEARSNLLPFLEAGTVAHDVVQGVAGLGDTTAPLPRDLLGRAKPLRGFIGQVEPTLDWTLQHPRSGANTAAGLTQPILAELLGGGALGEILDDWHRAAAVHLNEASKLKEERDEYGMEVNDRLLTFLQLAAADRRTTVLLGDPAVVAVTA
jgi:hypothetical protein